MTTFVPSRSIEECNRIMSGPGAPFEFEEKMIHGRNLRVYKHQPKTLRDVFMSTEAHSDKEYIIYENTRITFAAAFAQVEKIVQLLLRNGVQKGDKVAILSRNYPEWALVFWAAQCIGAVPAAINAWQTPDVLTYCIKHVESKVAFVDAERSALLKDHVRQLGVNAYTIGLQHEKIPLTSGFQDLNEVLKAVPGKPIPAASIEPDDVGIIFFTSGTTNLPKGVVSTHRAVICMTINSSAAMVRAALRRGEDLPPPPPPDAPQKAFFLTVPMFHVTGFHGFVLLSAHVGGKLVLIRKWDIKEAVPIIKRERITGGGGVPHMVMEILESEIKDDPDNPIEAFFFGGTAPSQRLPAVLKKNFPKAVAGHAYGLTEVNSIVTSVAGEDYLQRPSSCGLVPPNTEVSVRDDQGRELPPRTPGLLWFKGPQVALEYYKNPEATRKAFTPDGWFDTGDVGYRDEDGFVYLSDRAKDIIIRGGENISSIAVETAISADARIKEVAVLPVPDPKLGELVSALVVSQPPYDGKITSEEVIELVLKQLPKHCKPALVLFRPSSNPLPRNPNGKVVKKDITDCKEAWARINGGRPKL